MQGCKALLHASTNGHKSHFLLNSPQLLEPPRNPAVSRFHCGVRFQDPGPGFWGQALCVDHLAEGGAAPTPSPICEDPGFLTKRNLFKLKVFFKGVSGALFFSRMT